MSLLICDHCGALGGYRTCYRCGKRDTEKVGMRQVVAAVIENDERRKVAEAAAKKTT